MSTEQAARLGKRLLAILYDSLIVFFIIVVVLIIVQLIIGQGKEIPAESVVNHVLKSFWLIISFLYFGHYWTKRGQTPGMRVWKIKAISHNGSLMNWTQSASRYVFSLFGFGLLWMIVDKEHLALQDRMSKTRLIKTGPIPGN